VIVRDRIYGCPELVILVTAAPATAAPTTPPAFSAAPPENLLMTVSTISPVFRTERGEGVPAITEVVSKVMIDVNINEDITAILSVILDLIIIFVVNSVKYFLYCPKDIISLTT
jgi:hypothetical protein